MCVVKRLFKGGIFLVALVLLFVPVSADAAKKGMEIQSCMINTSNRNQVVVRAKGSVSASGTDGKYYLFGLRPYASRIKGSTKPLASCKRSKSIILRTALNKDKSDSVLYNKFIIAVKRKSGGYEIVSDPTYITNPDAVAKYRYSFPKATSKKGLQVSPTMLADAEDLGIKHAAVNILMDEFMALDWQKNDSNAYRYNYEGKTYWFLKSGCNGVDSQVRSLTQSNVVVSGILLLRGESQASVLVPPGAQGGSEAYYGLNTMNEDGVQNLSALVSFLGERYMGSSKANGRISNWIVGNEVDYYIRYNYMGAMSRSKYTKSYARSFRVISTALRSIYSNARVYIPLTNCWNQLQPAGGSYTAKSTLDGFVSALQNEGNIPWNVAYHAYPQPLTDPVFWDDIGSNSSSSQYITMNNIKVLTDYVKKKNKNCRVILSEQGFSSYTGGRGRDEKLQAAAYAYAYYIAEFNSQIDSLIITRHVDHVEEENQGIFAGIWSNRPGQTEYAYKQKRIWDVFKYIDTTASETISNFALKEIGISSWSSRISGFNWSKFKRMTTYNNGSLYLVKNSKGQKSLSNLWKYTYNGGTDASKNETTLNVDSNANNNLYRGVGQKFKKPLSFKTRSRFIFDIMVTGTRAKEAEVRVRFFNGKHIFEAASSILTGRKQQFSADLSNWKYRQKVSKIQVWVKPAKGVSWRTNGKITIANLKQASRISSVYISGFKSSLGAGKKMQLKVKGVSQKVTWVSSKPSIATINKKGMVKALKKGTVTIKAMFGQDMITRSLQVK